MFFTGLGHDNAWVGLNDRTVEEDFQWTDNNDLVSDQCLIISGIKSTVKIVGLLKVDGLNWGKWNCSGDLKDVSPLILKASLVLKWSICYNLKIQSDLLIGRLD